MKKIIQPASVEGVWRLRDKHPEHYPFTDDGNIRAIGFIEPKTKTSVPEKVYPLQSYRHATPEELETLWAQRDEAYAPIYEKIEAAKSELRTALLAFQTGTGTAKAVVEANQTVADAEAELILNRSPRQVYSCTSVIGQARQIELIAFGFSFVNQTLTFWCSFIGVEVDGEGPFVALIREQVDWFH